MSSCRTIVDNGSESGVEEDGGEKTSWMDRLRKWREEGWEEGDFGRMSWRMSMICSERVIVGHAFEWAIFR